MSNIDNTSSTAASRASSPNAAPAPIIERFDGQSSDGTPLTAVYAAQPAADVAFALVFPGDDLPRFVHWGKPLPVAAAAAADQGTATVSCSVSGLAAVADEALLSLYDAQRPQRVSGMLNDTAWPSVMPTQAESWIGEPRLNVRRAGVELFCKFAVTDIETTVADGTVPTVVVTADDAEQGVRLVWTAELLASGLVRQRAAIENIATVAADESSNIHEAAASLEIGNVELGFPIPATATEILTTTGHHLRERSPQRQPLTIGRFAKSTWVGRPDFDASLLLSSGAPGFGFEHGDVYSVHVGWSGNSALTAERLPYTTGLIGGGELLFGGEIELAAGERYESPWLYGAVGTGLNGVAARFHDQLRRWHPELLTKPRPVILNTWEAVYFDHDFETLARLADKAVESGVERFVVDDGWFGSRRDDSSGLGDWQISGDVWPEGPHGLKALADYVHARGMEFGLWFEPEMVNPDSDMFRAHPDWVLKPTAGRLPMEGRFQQVVDLTNPDAYAYVYGQMDRLIGELGIDYIKWDHNKLVTEAVSPKSGRPAVHGQTLAVYRIFHDLRQAHPGLEIESCSSGGGRVDLGILEHADRIWVSDCVDPVERADIQRYTSLLVPPVMMGEHVGASPAHSTHRATSQQMRMATAFFGHMGIEWNLLAEPQEAIGLLGEWTAEYKKRRSLFAGGLCLHADLGDPAVRLDGMMAADGAEAVFRFTQLTTSQSYPASPVPLPGLDPQALYRVRPFDVNLDLEAAGLANGQSPLGWWNENGVIVSGQALAAYGLRMPALHPAQAVLFDVRRIG
ncbi:alpha-galactosidase [Bifidobacterium sp. BRDM6]|uniref:alpha-galactosidase n=2 Tax=Bifidobacterium choloepi TaxID=2614131 RepID=A0A6I5NDL5_9BIFI|nr:alpha-galactosidase [Bifidobacterium choloepi]